MQTDSEQYELLKSLYLSNITKYMEALARYRLEHFSKSGIKAEMATLHHDMVMSCLPVYEMIGQVRIEF